MKTIRWIYLIGVHAMLVVALLVLVWVRVFDQGRPASLVWVGGANELTKDQRAQLESVDPNWVNTKYAFVRTNGNALAMLTFVDNELQQVDIAWPGDDTVLSLESNSSYLRQPGGIEAEDLGIDPAVSAHDTDGDRMFDHEFHRFVSDRGRRYFRRERQLRYEVRFSENGSECIVFNRLGEIAARVIDDQSGTSVRVEYLNGSTTIRSESIERDEYDIRTISDEVWETGKE